MGILLVIALAGSPDLGGGGTLRGIRSVDFRNFTYYSESIGGYVTLRHGFFSQKDVIGEGASTVSLESVQYAALTGDGSQQAVVVILTHLTGSMPTAVDCYVFEYSGATARPIFHQWQEGPAVACVQGRALRIVAASWDRRDAHCCPSFTETKRYRWIGGEFVVVSARTLLNHPFQRRNPFQCKSVLPFRHGAALSARFGLVRQNL